MSRAQIKPNRTDNRPHAWVRRGTAILITGALVLAGALTGTASANAATDVDQTTSVTAIPPHPVVVDTPTAKAELAQLVVSPPESTDGYSRAQFPHWKRLPGRDCDARTDSLRRDAEPGTLVTTDNPCEIVTGRWISPYDIGNLSTSNPGAFDVDHMVPLQNAWISGAQHWTRDRRQQYANDLNIPQLWSVSANSNRSKAAKSPDQWMPKNEQFACTYVRSWVQVKYTYQLHITQAEHDKLGGTLATCP